MNTRIRRKRVREQMVAHGSGPISEMATGVATGYPRATLRGYITTSRNRYRILLLICLTLSGVASDLMTSLPGPATAEAAIVGQARRDIDVTARLHRDQTFVGQPVTLEIRVAGAEPGVDPDVSDLEAEFDVTMVGSSSTSQHSTVIVNGRTQTTSFEGWVYRYELTPREVGELIVPPVRVTIDGVTHATDPLRLTVRGPSPHPNVALRLDCSDTSPFVGEAVTLRVTLLLRSRFQNANISIPGFESEFQVLSTDVDDDRDLTRPNVWSRGRNEPHIPMLGEEVPVEQGSEFVEGRQFTTYTAERLVVPLQPGEVVLGPAILSGQIVVRDSISMFSEPVTEAVAVPSEPIRITVRPVPEEGRPAGFSGLVGDFNIAAMAEPREVNVGDPVELEVVVRNRDGVTPDPQVDLLEQMNLDDAFRVVAAPVEATPDGGGLIFRWTMRPLSEQIDAIPSLELPYFDADREQFEIARTQPIPLVVRPTRTVTLDDAVRSSRPGAGGDGEDGPRGDAEGRTPHDELKTRDRGIAHNYVGEDLLRHRGFSLAATLRSPAWIAALAGPPVVWLLVATAVVRRRRRASGIGTRRREGALAHALAALRQQEAASSAGNAGPRDVTATIAGAVRTYIADRLNHPSAAGLTSAECGAILAGIDPERGRALQRILEECDSARYGGGVTPDQADALREETGQLLREIDRSGRPAGAAGARATGDVTSSRHRAPSGARLNAWWLIGALAAIFMTCGQPLASRFAGASGLAYATPPAANAPELGANATGTADGDAGAGNPAAWIAAADAAFERGMAELGGDADNRAALRRTGVPETARAEFAAAIALWQRVIDSGIENGGLHYNIGNANLMMGNLGEAIAAYRRAQAFRPNDPNVAANLAYARQQVKLKLGAPEPSSAMRILFYWHHDLPDRTRFLIFAGLFVTGWVWLIVRATRVWRHEKEALGEDVSRTADAHPVTSRSPSHGRLFTWPPVTILLLSIVMLGSVLWSAWGRTVTRHGVIVAESVVGRKGPSEAGYEPTFREPLPEGVEVLIVEDRETWVLIALMNGRTTWIPAHAVIPI